MKKSLLALVAAISLCSAKPAHAITFGDAALTVAISTAAGAGLGASTLPFYSESGDHTQNIFIGAAVGAVIGVFVAAASGVKEGDIDEAGASKLYNSRLAQRAKLVPDAITIAMRPKVPPQLSLARISF